MNASPARYVCRLPACRTLPPAVPAAGRPGDRWSKPLTRVHSLQAVSRISFLDDILIPDRNKADFLRSCLRLHRAGGQGNPHVHRLAAVVHQHQGFRFREPGAFRQELVGHARGLSVRRHDQYTGKKQPCPWWFWDMAFQEWICPHFADMPAESAVLRKAAYGRWQTPRRWRLQRRSSGVQSSGSSFPPRRYPG